jgi:macrolide transport system ATP-binding/permease protein
MSIFRRITNLFRRTSLRREIDHELASHIELRTEDNLARGMSPQQARRDALLRFGNPSVMREHTIAEDAALMLESIASDVRYACRQLSKNPGFAATAILVLALGIGASVAIFAFVDAALIKPLPYKEPARLTAVYETVPSCLLCNVSYQNFRDWQNTTHSFDALEVWGYARYAFHSPQGVQPLDGTRVSDGFFRLLGVTPLMGRDFYPGEDKPGSAHTLLISYGAWQKLFGMDPNVLGKVVQLDDLSYSIIGVLPRDFLFSPRGDADFWSALNDPDGCQNRRGCHSLFGVGRLKSNVSVASAAEEMKATAAQLEKQYPETNRGFGAVVLPLTDAVVGKIRPILIVLLSGAGLLLLIACVNVVSLLLLRSEGRRQEIAVRGALGASLARLMRQFLTEGVVLVAAGTALGLALAYVAMRMLLSLIPASRLLSMPYLQGLGFTSHVVIFAACIAFLAVVLLSAAPALRLKARDMRGDLAEGSRGSAGKAWKRLGSKLVMVELATAVVLLVGAGLLGKSLYRLLQVNTGFAPDHLASVVVSIPKTYSTDAQVMQLERSLQTRLNALPGVRSTAITSSTPVRDWDGGTYIWVSGRPLPKERTDVPERDVSASYLPTIGAKLLQGRYFTDQEDDPAKPRVVVINQTMAKQFLPGEDPIGKQLTYVGSKQNVQVIGVVEDIKEGQLDTANRAAMYVPFNQDSWGSFDLVIRTSQEPGALLPTLTSAIHEIDKEIPVTNGVILTEDIRDSNSAYFHRISAWLVSSFAALALVLAVIGLYGVIAYSVAQRTREIGVRMALGAQRASVYQLILREAAWLVVIGIAAGLLSSIAASSLMRSLLFGTQAWDIPTLAVVAAVLTLSALMASYIPARRAASVNPVEALRAE